jgi:hypothetical protein
MDVIGGQAGTMALENPGVRGLQPLRVHPPSLDCMPQIAYNERIVPREP